MNYYAQTSPLAAIYFPRRHRPLLRSFFRGGPFFTVTEAGKTLQSIIQRVVTCIQRRCKRYAAWKRLMRLMRSRIQNNSKPALNLDLRSITVSESYIFIRPILPRCTFGNYLLCSSQQREVFYKARVLCVKPNSIKVNLLLATTKTAGGGCGPAFISGP